MPSLIEDIKSLVEQGSLDGIKALASTAGIQAVIGERDPKFKRQAVHFAAKANRTGILSWLRENGADLESRDIDQSRPLHLAAMNGASEAARTLLSYKVEVDPVRTDGKTPLIFALSLSQKGASFAACAQSLLAAGANPGVADAEGKTAADHTKDLTVSRWAGVTTKELSIDPTQLDPAVAKLLSERDKLNRQVASAFDDPTASGTPVQQGPKTSLGQDSGTAESTEMPREDAIKKLKDLGFEILGASDGVPQIKGRNAEVAEASSLLDKRKNVLLVGKAGTGKRSLARACAESLAAKGKIIMSVPSAVFRGNKYAGSVNENIQKWLGPALSLGDELVLFINDAHQLSTGKTSSDNTDTPLQILREQMDSRKDKRLTLLCATSPKEIKSLEEDEAFLGHFSRKNIEPMNPEATLEAMISPAGSRQLLADRPDTDKAAYDALCKKTVDLCSKYLFNQCFPGKAFEFASRALAQDGTENWTGAKLGAFFCKTYSVPREIVEGRMSTDSAFYRLQSELAKKVMGQEGPIAEISEAVSSQVVLANPESHKPVSMLFAGPTGVGKTETADSMAKILGLPILTLNMGEFTAAYDAGKLKDLIAEFATKNYAGVILVDEIEKSHPVVRDILLNLFDKGVVGSGDDEVKCGFMIAVATTNVGASAAVAIKRKLREEFGNPKIHDSWTRDQMINAGFRPEFINRIDLACDFNDITSDNALKIAKVMFASKAKALSTSRGVTLDVDDSVAKDHAADVFDSNFGARGIRRCVDKVLQSIVADSKIALAIGPGTTLKARSANGAIMATVHDSHGVTTESSIGSKDENTDLSRLNAVMEQFAQAVSQAATVASAPKSSQNSKPAA